MSFKQYPDKASALDAAEALGRLFATSIGAAWPMRQIAYGPTPFPPLGPEFYQRYWQAPLDAVTVAQGAPKDLPIRIEADPFVQAQDGKAVVITGGKQVTLDFKGLQT